MSSSQFAHAGMTPRAWRMLSYCCVGFFLYCFVLFVEVYQDYRLTQIDAALKMSRELNAGSVSTP